MNDMYLCTNSDGKEEAPELLLQFEELQAPEQLFQELDDYHQEKISGGINRNTTRTTQILYEDAHNQYPPLVPPCQGGSSRNKHVNRTLLSVIRP
jgi:hypothetical protein